MRLVSFSEYEAGVIAIGGSPFGIIAIGGLPVGVIAVGIVPMGLVSFACGAGLGLVNYTCGIGAGAYVRSVGVAIGGDAFAVGLPLGIAGERPTPETASRPTVEPDEALCRADECWVECKVDRGGHLRGLPAPVELEDSARRTANRLRDRKVFAKLRAVHPSPPLQHGYREAAEAPGPYFVCLAVEDATPRTPWRPLLWYAARVAFVGAIVLAVLGHVMQERIALTKMSRTVEATWQARPAKAEGLHIAADTPCSVRAKLRSDGQARLHADLTVRCGTLELAQRKLRSGCSVEQAQEDRGYRYRLRCAADRVARSEDSDGNVTPETPGLEMDTMARPGRARVWAQGPPPMNVRLEVDALSEPAAGEPLLLPGRARLDAP